MTDRIFDRCNAVYVKNVRCKGRGVFANVPFKVGDVIDRAPTWAFEGDEAAILNRTGLIEYYFVRDDLKREANNRVVGYVVFGFISLVNHSSNPNAETIWTDGEAGAWASIVAIKDIMVDEEITHRYKNIPDYPSKVKFIE